MLACLLALQLLLLSVAPRCCPFHANQRSPRSLMGYSALSAHNIIPATDARAHLLYLRLLTLCCVRVAAVHVNVWTDRLVAMRCDGQRNVYYI